MEKYIILTNNNAPLYLSGIEFNSYNNRGYFTPYYVNNKKYALPFSSEKNAKQLANIINSSNIKNRHIVCKVTIDEW